MKSKIKGPTNIIGGLTCQALENIVFFNLQNNPMK